MKINASNAKMAIFYQQRQRSVCLIYPVIQTVSSVFKEHTKMETNVKYVRKIVQVVQMRIPV